MRRSSVVKLTLLPLLAASAIAMADIADDPPPQQAPTPTPAPPPDPDLGPPGLTDPVLTPPGMTPTIRELDCDQDPNWRQRPDCVDDDGYYEDYYGGDTYVVRGGFGHYFWTGGG